MTDFERYCRPFSKSCSPFELIGCCIGKYNRRLEGYGLLAGHVGVGYHDNNITGSDFSGSRAIETNNTASALTFNNIGFQSLAVHTVEHLDLFTFNHVGRLHQERIQRDAADVVQISFRDRNPMDFRLEYFNQHSRKNRQSMQGIVPRLEVINFILVYYFLILV